MKKSAVYSLFLNSSPLDRAFLHVARNDADVRDALMPFLKEAAKWEHLPKGWTQDSVKKFWNSLTGEVKHKVTKCMEKMKGKVDDTGAFCGSLADVVDPGWRSRRTQHKAGQTLQAKKNDSIQWKPYTGRPLQLSTKELQQADEQWTVAVRPQPNGKWMVAVVRVEGTKGYPWGSVAYVSDQKDISKITQQQLRMISKMNQGGNMADSSRLRQKTANLEEAWGPLLKQSSSISDQIKNLGKKFNWNIPDRSSALADWHWVSGASVNHKGEHLHVSKKKPDDPEGYFNNPAQSGHITYLNASSASKVFSHHKITLAFVEMLALVQAGVVIGPQTLKIIRELSESDQVPAAKAKNDIWDAIWADASSGKLFSPKFTYKWFSRVQNWSLD